MLKLLPAATLLLLCACQSRPQAQVPSVPIPTASWQNLDFGSNGDSEITADLLTIEHGERLAGLQFTGDVDALLGKAREHYEITLEAQRTAGNDLFLGLTFPVGKESASLVLGGWGGSVCGISSVDGADAATNAHKSIHVFDDNRWYRVRLQVTPGRVQAWLEGKPLFDIARAKVKRFEVRGEVGQTVPLGLFTFGTSAQIRNMAVRKPR